MKRKLSIDESTPSKKRARSRTSEQEHLDDEEDILQMAEDFTISTHPTENAFGEGNSDVITPVKRKPGRPKGSKNTPKAENRTVTPSKLSHGKKLFSTPTKIDRDLLENGTPSIPRNADRSARRKSARAIIEKTLEDLTSEDEEDQNLARHIYDLDDNVDDGDDDRGTGHTEEPESAPTTPSKRGPGRPKGAKNRHRSPTPPKDLPPHELYFAQNKGASSKTSNNNLSSLKLLDHEEYFSLMREYQDPHIHDIEFLEDLHSRSFHQWQFELSQNFNICIYGLGSKRSLLTRFATHVYHTESDDALHRIVVVNGYLHNASVRDVLNTLSTAISSHPQKLGSQPPEMLESLCRLLEAESDKHITLIINSIDAVGLRKAASQNILARLASHPQISLIASADHPNFPLLWDSSLRSSYNFLFHDCTTFQPYNVEIDVVDEVHSLLGRSGRRVGGKEGVSFVLKSLPVKAKDLFRVLVAEQLATMDDGGRFDLGENNEDDFDNDGPRRHKPASEAVGVEYNLLYQKAAEDFICPNEMTFRTLLKEFYDHQMIESRKDASGTEILSVPFRKEELETILEDLMS